MGAANSKKRRKERKKRKSSATYPAGLPRSASADVIRSLHVMPLGPACQQCGGPRQQRVLSTSLGDKWSHLVIPQSYSPSSITRTFSDSLAASGSRYNHDPPCSTTYCNTLHCRPHQCASYCTGPHEGPHDDSGWDSDHGPQVTCPYDPHPLHPPYPSWSHPRPNRISASGPHSVPRSLSQPPTCMATSTMSLTRGAPQRQFYGRRSRSSDFGEEGSRPYPGLHNTLVSHDLGMPLPDSSMRSSTLATNNTESNFTDACAQSQLRVPSVPSIKLTKPRDRAVRCGREFDERLRDLQKWKERELADGKSGEKSSVDEGREEKLDEGTNRKSGVPLTLVEDERARLARWEQSKLRAQQLRLLRRHIQAQESGQVPPPTTPSILPSNSSPPPSPQDSPLRQSVTETKVNSELMTETGHTPVASQPPKKPPRSKFSKRRNFRNLDNHPVMSKLQNEQNNRLERLEQRMCQIKANAMQEAQRRHFAEIFPAREDSSENERLMQEARDTLKLLQAEKERRLASTHSSSTPVPPDRNMPDSPSDGDIIPVHVLSGSQTVCDRSQGDRNVSLNQSGSLSQTKKEVGSHVGKSHWLNDMWPYINLGQPSTWLLLPFLLFPLVLRLLLSLVISLSCNSNNNNDNNSSSSSTRAEVQGNQHCGLSSLGKTLRGERGEGRRSKT